MICPLLTWFTHFSQNTEKTTKKLYRETFRKYILKKKKIFYSLLGPSTKQDKHYTTPLFIYSFTWKIINNSHFVIDVFMDSSEVLIHPFLKVIGKRCFQGPFTPWYFVFPKPEQSKLWWSERLLGKICQVLAFGIWASMSKIIKCQGNVQRAQR